MLMRDGEGGACQQRSGSWLAPADDGAELGRSNAVTVVQLQLFRQLGAHCPTRSIAQ